MIPPAAREGRTGLGGRGAIWRRARAAGGPRPPPGAPRPGGEGGGGRRFPPAEDEQAADQGQGTAEEEQPDSQADGGEAVDVRPEEAAREGAPQGGQPARTHAGGDGNGLDGKDEEDKGRHEGDDRAEPGKAPGIEPAEARGRRPGQHERDGGERQPEDGHPAAERGRYLQGQITEEAGPTRGGRGGRGGAGGGGRRGGPRPGPTGRGAPRAAGPRRVPGVRAGLGSRRRVGRSDRSCLVDRRGGRRREGRLIEQPGRGGRRGGGVHGAGHGGGGGAGFPAGE